MEICIIIQILGMMNNSNGFSSMGNSTGFKKRQLLRPPSGLLNKRQQQFLRSLDISQSEPVIATSLRGEVAAIDEEISLLDKDRRIRQGDTSLQKGYVGALRKWLREGQGERQDDDVKIMKQMGVDSYESGFRKLWKIAGHLDLVISKVTELQIVHLLQYEDMFAEIGEDSQRSVGLLAHIANSGYSPATFQVGQVLLHRSKDVYCAWADLRKKGGKGREEVREGREREETNDLIRQLRQQNTKLNSLLEQLSAERQLETSKKPSVDSKETAISSDNARSVFKEVEEKYKEQLKYQSDQRARAQAAVIELRVKLSTLESQLKSFKQSDKPASGSVPKSGSYEQALIEQMQKMKRGFQRRISILTDQFTTRERELRKREGDYKSENEKVKWQKSLLLKKFDLLVK